MDFSKFLEFPGILILVGALLLIIVLIISLVANKKSKNKKKPEENIVPVEQGSVDNAVPVADAVVPPVVDSNDNVANQENIAPVIESEPVAEPVVEQQPVVNNNPWQTTSNIYGGVNPTEGINIDIPKSEPVTPYEEKDFAVSETPIIPKQEPIEQPIVEIPTINVDTSQEVEIDKKDEEIETL